MHLITGTVSIAAVTTGLAVGLAAGTAMAVAAHGALALRGAK